MDSSLALYRSLTEQHTVSCESSNAACSISRVFADNSLRQPLPQAQVHTDSACNSADDHATKDARQCAAQSCSIHSCLLLPVFDRQGSSSVRPVAVFELASGAADLDWEVTGDCLSHAAQVGSNQVVHM